MKVKEKITGIAVLILLFAASGIGMPDGSISVPNVVLCGACVAVTILVNIGGGR